MSQTLPYATYGEVKLLLNAGHAEAAEDLAIESAANMSFERRNMAEAEAEAVYASELGVDFGAADPAGQQLAASCPEGGGTWTARVSRIGYPDANGRETHSDYCLLELIFNGARPHARPHACDDPKHWAAVARAMDERDALGSHTAQPSQDAGSLSAPRL